MQEVQPAWHPEAYARRRPNLVKRSAITAAIRKFFLEDGFMEVETPILQVSPGMEPHLQAFHCCAPDGQCSVLSAHFAEFACKKLLTAGEERFYPRPGFRTMCPLASSRIPMLEWYRRQATSGDGGLPGCCKPALRRRVPGRSPMKAAAAIFPRPQNGFP